MSLITKNMTFSQLALYFAKLDSIASRNEMTKILAELFKTCAADEIGKICYLLQGRVAPLYEPIEFGMADKMVIRAISIGVGNDLIEINKYFKRTGDLGITVEELKSHLPASATLKALQAGNVKIKNTNQNLKINQVFDNLFKLATISGLGSQEKKTNLLGELIKSVDPLSAKYIIRIVLAKLRLGFSDMTMLDSLSWMNTNSKDLKPLLENAYNVRPDLADIAQITKKEGEKGLKKISPQPGTPIRMARADRLTSALEIFEKIGKSAVEYKYDGLRLQVHFDKKKILKKINSTANVQQQLIPQKDIGLHARLFSRNLEDITHMFPDIVAALEKQITTDSVIFEGEVVAYNPKTGSFVPFQETMQRKRKYDIAQKALEIPVKLFVFELLYCNGKNYINESYATRKAKLKSIIKSGNTIVYAQEKVVQNPQNIEDMFDESMKLNFEGIIAKKLDGVYEAGMRGWNWIKYKKGMNKKLTDTFDVLVMGLTKGEGKRTGFGVGQFLTGVYDEGQEKFVTLTKIGTGLTDEQFRELAEKTKNLKTGQMPKNYDVDKLLFPDSWLQPKLVVEISGDEITRSSVHTAGRVMQASKSGKAFSIKESGYALRFPRLERFRSDKSPHDATTLKEVKDMFKKQKK